MRGAQNIWEVSIDRLRFGGGGIERELQGGRENKVSSFVTKTFRRGHISFVIFSNSKILHLFFLTQYK